MKILVNSDSSIAMDAKLAMDIMGEATELLDRFSDRLTRVEIHLSDVNRGKTGRVDKKCIVEVRPARMKPMVATAQTADVATAVSQAMRKTVRALNTTLGKRGLVRAAAKPAHIRRAKDKALGPRPAKKTVKSGRS
jgi:hypothetical protein